MNWQAEVSSRGLLGMLQIAAIFSVYWLEVVIFFKTLSLDVIASKRRRRLNDVTWGCEVFTVANLVLLS